MRERSWTLEQALELIRDLKWSLQPVGYGLGLTGSVLHRGESSSDLDLIVYPLDVLHQDLDRVYRALEDFGLRRFASREKVHEVWRGKGSVDAKHVEIWRVEASKKRVDIFFLS